MVPPNGTEDEDHGDLDYVNPSFFFFFFFHAKKIFYIFFYEKSFIFLFFKRNYKFHSLTLSYLFSKKKKKKKFVSVGTETINFIDTAFYSLQFVC